MANFSSSSKEKLETCHPDLERLFNKVVQEIDCTIIEGHRDMEKQKQYFREGRTKTLASKHLSLPSMAVDVMPYPIDWEDKKRMYEFATFVKGVAHGMGIKIRWGGDFKSFFDAPHWELV